MSPKNMVKDICRICLQEVDYHELEKISLPKLSSIITSKPIISLPFIQKWQIELFKNHQICSTCLHNFHIVKVMYKYSYKAYNAIQIERKKNQLSRVNLKRLTRFSHIEGDFLVCRLCLNPTRQVAIYLYDYDRNILPMDYIKKMLHHAKIYVNSNNTINPILCSECWQNIQILYSFTKHLELVTEKMFYYQVLVDKIYIDREDLQNVLHMWDHLGVINVKNEVDVLVKKEMNDECNPALNHVKSSKRNLEGSTQIKKRVAEVKEEYSFHNEHNYFKMNDNSDVSGNINKNRTLTKKINATQDRFEESICEMPLLTLNVHEEEPLKDMPKLQPNIEPDIENKSSGSTRKLRSKTRFIERNEIERLGLTPDSENQKENAKAAIGKNSSLLKIVADKQELKKIVQNKLKEKPKDTTKEKKELNTFMQDKKFRNIKKYKVITEDQVNSALRKKKVANTTYKKQKDKPDGPSVLLPMETIRPRTRLSTKKEIVEDPFSQDLLILRKEEIIKKTRQKRKPKTSLLTHTSTPKISKSNNRENVSVSCIENSPSKSNSCAEYTFETLNLNDEVQVKKEAIEEEELQIKKEMLSECESDDQFIENVEYNTNSTEDLDEECPNLESFIKSEPLDESYAMDLDEEGPPELEFQGPCQSVPIPMPYFSIKNIFTVYEKRHLINTVDEKRHIINTADEKRNLINAVDVERRIINTVDNQHNFIYTVDEKRRPVNTMDDKGYPINTGDEKRLPINTVDNQRLSINIGEKGLPINTVDKKSNLLTLMADKTPSVNLADNSRRSDTNVSGVKKYPFTPAVSKLASFQTNQRSLLKINNQKPEQEACIKVTGDLLNPTILPKTAQEDCPKLSKNLIASVMKFDQEPTLPAHAEKKAGNVSGSSNANVESQLSAGNLMMIDGMRISRRRPFFCKMCDFSCITKYTAKNHISLHDSNIICLNKCTECSFATTRKNRFYKHVAITHVAARQQKHLRSSLAVSEKVPQEAGAAKNQDILCDFCIHIISRLSFWRSCKDCNKQFHLSCFKMDRKDCRFSCQHQNSYQNFPERISKVKGATEDQEFFCDFCLLIISKFRGWQSCKDCNKLFHCSCFKKDQSVCKFNCQHRNSALLMYEMVSQGKELISAKVGQPGKQKVSANSTDANQHVGENGEQAVCTNSPHIDAEVDWNQKAVCDYCENMLRAVKKVCKKCNKVFHVQCFKDDQKAMKFNCSHGSTNDSGTALGKEQSVRATCNFCKGIVTKQVICTKCKRVFHRKCFIKDLVKRKFHCKHFAGPVTETIMTRLATIRNEAAKDDSFSNVPSTSKELKQEMLDASVL